MILPPELEEIYPAMRLVTAGFFTMGELDDITIDDVEDLTITLDAEADANARRRKKQEARR